jgi:hypothetical protein
VRRLFPERLQLLGLRRPLSLLRKIQAADAQATQSVIVVPPTVSAQIVSSRVVMADGKMNLAHIAFIDDISASVTVKMVDAGTSLQIGSDMTDGPGTDLNTTAVDVEIGVIVEFYYKTDVSTSGYSDITTWKYLTRVAMVDTGSPPIEVDDLPMVTP